MSQPVQKSITQIFIQFIAALIVFSALAGVAAAGTHSYEQNNVSVTHFNLLDASSYDRRIEGRMRASLTFDKKLSKLGLQVRVQESRLTISGTVTNDRVLDAIQELALELVSAEQINLQVNVQPNNLLDSDTESNISKLAAWFK
ncbi:hypothetical protein OAP14_02815 [Aliiglaciecola sp.]|nr:hypothetical protein [Aliiglaciecola sp.]